MRATPGITHMTMTLMHAPLAIPSLLLATFLAAPASAQTSPPMSASPESPPPTPAVSSEPALPSVPSSLPAPQPAPQQSKDETPPISLATRPKEVAVAPTSWFARSPLAVSVGEGTQKWQLTIYGFVEADVINDSTRSYGDSIDSAIVARDELYEGQQGRTQFSIRNTRIGFALQAPVIGGVKPSATIEGDFFGNQPAKPPSVSESSYFNRPTFSIRHAYLKLENDYVDVWAGQTYDLFGWQNYFFPCSVEFFGLPNQAFGRTAQVRLAHTFASDAVNVDLAVAALRPAQRDSEIPDTNAGIRLSLNHWKGISTPGNGGTAASPLAIGISTTVRSFKVDAFTPPPTQASNHATGWGLSVDALVPVIPAKDSSDRGNRLTLTGSFVVGSGIADLVNAGGGANFPTLPNPAMISPPPLYTPDIDNGLVTFDTAGVLHTIDWQTFMAGIQYYLPPTGRVILSANYTEAFSKNIADLFPRGGAEIMLFSRVAKRSRYADFNAFFDVTPAVRIGASFQYTTTEYIDGATPRNFRWMAQAVYFF
jgi:hypothetical protein